MILINNCINRWILNKVLDLMFGEEEDLEYTPIPMPPPPPT